MKPLGLIKTASLTALITTICTVLTACSGSDSSSGSGYVQLYNGSYNSPYTRLFVEDVERSGASFGDVTTRHNYSSDNYDISFQYLDANDSYITFDERTVSISGDKTELLVMNGDFDAPTFSELSIPVGDDEDSFNIGFFNIVDEGQSYDIYLAQDDGLFETAEMITTAGYLLEPDLLTYDEGYYTLYITESGQTDILFESATIYLSDYTSYIAMIRPSYANDKSGVSLDVVTSSNSVTELKHQDAQGQLRFINTIDDYPLTSFSVTRGSYNNITEVSANDTYTGYTTTDPNSYSIAMLDDTGATIVDNFLLTLEREQSKVGIFYQDVDYGPRMITVEEDLTPSSYDHNVTVVNLLESFAGQEISDVDIYFTLDGETIDDAKNTIDSLDMYDQQEQSVDNEMYTVYVVYEDNGQQIVLIQQSDMDFTQEGNYILILEHDETSTTGYKMTLERTITDSVE